MDPIVIVGAGHGGSQLAAALREEGVAEPIVLLSNEDALPYHRPPLSKAFQKAPDAAAQVLRPESFYRDHGVDLRFSETVVRIEPGARRLVTAAGRVQPYCRLVLATGARPRPLPVPGAGLDNVLTLRSLADAARLRAVAAAAAAPVIIGGGYIGLEIAFTLAYLGKSVTVLESAPAVLGRVVAPELARHVAARAAAAGIVIRTGVTIAALEGAGGRVEAIVLASGERLASDLCLVGVGARPNDELAREAGLATANGIVVDGQLRTSDPLIQAIGDCVEYRHWQVGRPVRLESVQNANDQAKHAARVIAGATEAYREVPWFWSDQGDMKLQIVGLSHDADRQVRVGDPQGNAFAIYRFAGERLVAIETVNRPADHMLGRRLLATGYSPSVEEVMAGPAALKARLAERTVAA